MKKVVFVMLTLLLILVSLFTYYISSLYTRVSVENRVSDFEYRVSKIKVNWYLNQNYYNLNIDDLIINLVPDAQTAFIVPDENGRTLQSVSAGKQGKDLVLNVHYIPEQIQKVGSTKNAFTRDLYMYLCLALDLEKPDPNGCYQKADNHIEREKGIPFGETVKVVKKGSVISWLNFLVKEVHAQSCVGVIPCGGWEYNPFTGATICNYALNNNNCSSLSTESSCNAGGYVSDCSIHCNPSADDFCSWSSSGGGGSCPGQCMRDDPPPGCGSGYSSSGDCGACGLDMFGKSENLLCT